MSNPTPNALAHFAEVVRALEAGETKTVSLTGKSDQEVHALLFSPARNGTPQKEKGQSGDAPKGIVMDTIAPIAAKSTLIKREPIKLAPATPAIEYSGVVEMTPTEWSLVIDNPRQRDTEAHARRADHLRVAHAAHCKVNMARLPDGTLYKLDGHTRSYLWARGELVAPPRLYVDLWECRSLQDVKGLYGTFDSKKAVETTSDQIYGAKRERKVEFKSSFLTGGKFASGMRLGYELMHGGDAAREISIYELLRFWEAELKLLDDCMPTSSRFHTGVAVTSLLTFRRYGSDAGEFWTLFAKGAGTKVDGEQDAVQALEERMEKQRREQKLVGRANIIEVVTLCLSAFDRFRIGKRYIYDLGDSETKKRTRRGGIKPTGAAGLREFVVAATRARRVV